MTCITSPPSLIPLQETLTPLDTDSDGTVIYKTTGSVGTGKHAANLVDTQSFYLTEQWNAQYNSDIIEIWKNDAKKKKWTVPVVNLSKSDIYVLSKPAPNWDQIDAYSSIEDIGSSSGGAKPSSDSDGESTKTLPKRHTVCTKLHNLDVTTNQGLRRSKHN